METIDLTEQGIKESWVAAQSQHEPEVLARKLFEIMRENQELRKRTQEVSMRLARKEGDPLGADLVGRTPPTYQLGQNGLIVRIAVDNLVVGEPSTVFEVKIFRTRSGGYRIQFGEDGYRRGVAVGRGEQLTNTFPNYNFHGGLRGYLTRELTATRIANWLKEAGDPNASFFEEVAAPQEDDTPTVPEDL